MAKTGGSCYISSVKIICYLVLGVAFLPLACGGRKPAEINPSVSSSLSSAPETIFPHPDQWKNPESHGKWVVKNNLNVCFQCHKLDSSSQEGPPSCHSCHTDFPHAIDWVKPENHGALILKNGKSGCTTECHGTDLAGGLSGISCNLCHTIYPHTDTWKNPGEHGVTTKKNGTIACQACHGNDLAGGTAQVSCTQCHKQYPHDADWKTPEKHGAFVLANGKATCATECHGSDLTGGLSGVSCNFCHTVYPHTDTWASPGEHGDAAHKDTSKTICQSCHGNDLNGGTAQVSCTQCHKQYPHDTDWKTPEKHGAFVLQNGQASCATECHGEDLKGGLAQVACNSCHTAYPHPQGWEAFEGHGREVKKTLGGDLATCQSCHGIDFQGGNTGVACSQCHANYPHPSDWKQGAAHGPKAYGDGKNSCASSSCHGSDFKGGPYAPSCYSCHADFPHADAEWTTLTPQRESQRDESFHGDRFIRKSQRGEAHVCDECHGANYDRSVGGAQCTTCHATGITHKNINNAAWNTGMGHGKFFSDRFRSTDSTAFCFSCHGTPVDFNGTQTKENLKSISFCYNCHAAYPHISFTGASWEPVRTTTCGPRTTANTNWGHTSYLAGVTDLPTTCGSGGSCHTQGNRSYQLNYPASLICGESCHGAGARVAPLPAIVPCPPPPASQLSGPPTVAVTAPANGEQNVTVGVAHITAQFNEPMDPASLQAGTFIVRKSGELNALAGSVTCDQQLGQAWCQTATVNLAMSLQYGTPYEAKITMAVKDFGGTPLATEYRWTFTTVAQDTTRPTVISTNPANNATNVPIPALGPVILTVQFSEPIAQEVIGQTPIQLRKGGTLVNGSPSWVPSNCQTNCQTMAYSFPGLSNTRYTATVLSVIRDLQGNFISAPYTWTFTTGR